MCIQPQRVFGSGKIDPAEIIQSSRVLICSDRKMESMLWIAKTLLSFNLNIRSDNDRTRDVFVKHMKCARALAQVDKKVKCVHLR